MQGEEVQGVWDQAGHLGWEDARSVSCSKLLLSWEVPYLRCLGGGGSMWLWQSVGPTGGRRIFLFTGQVICCF